MTHAVACPAPLTPPSAVRKIRLNLTILFGSLLFFTLIAELILRSLVSGIEFADRYFMWSSPLLTVEQDGAVHYLPHQKVREAAVFGKTLEYDVSFTTNNLGLVDHLDQPAPGDEHRRGYAFLGDSFTSGVGGGPWVAEMRDRIASYRRDVQIYNISHLGASIDHFHKNLTHFSKILPIKEVVLVAISDDFHRLYWKPITTANEVRMCPEGEADDVCMKRRAIATVIDPALSEAGMWDHVGKIRAEQLRAIAEKQSSIPFPLRLLVQWSRLASLSYKYLNQDPLFALAENKQTIGDGFKSFLRKKNMEKLAELKAAFPSFPMTFIHLPEKSEIADGKYYLDPSKELGALGIRYFPALSQCGLTGEMYHPNDTHPNKQGYAKISQCIEAFLFADKLSNIEQL